MNLTEYGGAGEDGWFFYTVDEESGLDYTASGELFDCTYTGSGHIEPLHSSNGGDTLEMNFEARKYDIYDRLPFADTSSYPIFLQCPDTEPGVSVGPLGTDEWIRTGYQPRGFPAGFTTLEGQFIVDVVPPVNFSWNLQADVP